MDRLVTTSKLTRLTAHLLLVLTLITSAAAHSAERITYYHNDNLGSPVAATDTQGNVVWRENYQSDGTRNLHQGDSQNKLWFTGKQEESTFGVSYFGARWYDPEMGRFLAMDPVGVSASNPNSFNRYAYANNNPYRFVDPDGRMSIVETDGLAILGISGLYIYYSLPPESQRAMQNLLQRGFEQIRDANSFFPTAAPLLPPTMSADAGSEQGVPPLPGSLVGEQDKKAGQQGKRHNSGPLAEENGGTGNAEEDFGKLTGGTAKPAPEGSNFPQGTLVGENGITLRPRQKNIGPRIDIPANGSKPAETLHYPPSAGGT